MTQPHHHAFNALEPLFHRKVPILPLIPILIEKDVISADEIDLKWFKDEHNGIKILTGYLRSKNYDTFLKFIESIFEVDAQQYDSASGGNSIVDFSLMKSVKEVVVDFDKKYNTTHADRIEEIFEKYSRKSVHEESNSESSGLLVYNSIACMLQSIPYHLYHMAIPIHWYINLVINHIYSGSGYPLLM